MKKLQMLINAGNEVEISHSFLVNYADQWWLFIKKTYNIPTEMLNQFMVSSTTARI